MREVRFDGLDKDRYFYLSTIQFIRFTSCHFY